MGWDSILLSGPAMDCFRIRGVEGTSKVPPRQKAPPPKKADKKFVNGIYDVNGSGGKGGHSFVLLRLLSSDQIPGCKCYKRYQRGKNVNTSITFAKSTKRIDALYDFSSQSGAEERSIFRQTSVQSNSQSHQELKAQGHQATLDSCFAFNISTLNLYCLHYQHSYQSSN